MTEGEQASMLKFIRKLQRERGEQETITSARTPTVLKNKLLDKLTAYNSPGDLSLTTWNMKTEEGDQ